MVQTWISQMTGLWRGGGVEVKVRLSSEFEAA